MDSADFFRGAGVGWFCTTLFFTLFMELRSADPEPYVAEPDIKPQVCLKRVHTCFVDDTEFSAGNFVPLREYQMSVRNLQYDYSRCRANLASALSASSRPR